VVTGGKPAQVYCGHQIPIHRLDHDWRATQALLDMNATRIERFDLHLRQDANFSIQAKKLSLELDMGNESTRQLRMRISVLQKSMLPIVWVTTTPARVKTIQKCCNPIGNKVFYSTFASAGEIWIDHFGNHWDVVQGVVKVSHQDNERGAN